MKAPRLTHPLNQNYSAGDKRCQNWRGAPLGIYFVRTNLYFSIRLAIFQVAVIPAGKIFARGTKYFFEAIFFDIEGEKRERSYQRGYFSEDILGSIVAHFNALFNSLFIETKSSVCMTRCKHMERDRVNPN